MHEPIAIIGMACRFPGARDVAEFHDLLRRGRDAVGNYPRERPGSVPFQGGYLRDVDRFDASFFNISPREARAMDPQQRILLELTYRTMEDAGMTPRSMASVASGVFVAIATDDYARLQMADHRNLDVYSNTGSAFSIAANRISYQFNLRGPSMAVDTACSSSLTAVQLACSALRAGEVETAFVGAVNLILEPAVSMGHARMGLYAADGRCKPFDARADGITRSEGAGVLLLMPLAKALKGGHAVHAVIRGAALNQDGRSNGLTAPSGKAQVEVLRAAYAAAGVAPRDVAYVEAHGTGTLLGDPIEARALGEVLGESRREPCRIGSVKGNIGHTEAAAGIAGLIKSVLMLKHGEFLPSIHFRRPNPHIPFAKLGLRVQRRREKWNGPMLAGVSSFGFGGTNGHLVLEAAPRLNSRRLKTPRKKKSAKKAARDARDEKSWLFLPLSARNPEALRELAANWHAALSGPRDVSELKRLCRAAGTRGEHFEHRLGLVFRAKTELRRRLKTDEPGEAHARRPRLIFLFSGQGSVHPGMARELFAENPVCGEVLRDCTEQLRGMGAGVMARDIRAALLGTGAAAGKGREKSTAAMKQVMLFITQAALFRLLDEAGVRPDAVVGHSLGEVAAATAAGSLTLSDGLRIAYHRGRVCAHESAAGVMAAMRGGLKKFRELEPGHPDVHVAADNGPDSVVLSGSRKAMAALLRDLKARDINHRVLDIDFAAHGPLMTAPARELRSSLKGLRPREGGIDVYSSTRGGKIPGRNMNAEYWAENLRRPVQFAAAARAAVTRSDAVFLELSPDPILGGTPAHIFPAGDAEHMATLRAKVDSRRAFMETLAELYMRGMELDFERVFGREPTDASSEASARIPPYPFQRESYWFKDDVGETDIPGLARVALNERSRLLPENLSREKVMEQTAVLNEIALAGMGTCLRRMGLFGRAGESHKRRELPAKAGVTEEYVLLFDKWISLLVENGVLREQGDALTCARPPADGLPEKNLSRARKLFVETPAIPEYLEHCVKLLPDVLRGRESPLETLFPRGEFQRTDALYHEWPVVRYFNGLVAEAARTFASARSDIVRILEVGAGTAGTTRAVLPLLPSRRVEYEFTDVSDFFTGRAREMFADKNFMRFSLLDLEQEPEGQGARDIIIAANVVHAARDIAQVLKRLLGLLAPGGMLILYETTIHHAWFNVATALIEGWRKFDDGVRVEHPLLDGKQWKVHLGEAGFEHAAVYPESDTPLTGLGQNVILAFRPDGVPVGMNANMNADANAFRAKSSEMEKTEAKAPSVAPVVKGELENYVRAQLGRVLRIAPERIHATRPLRKQGLDSLMMVDLRNRLRTDLGRELSAADLKNIQTLDNLVRRLEQTRNDKPAGASAESSAKGTNRIPLSPPQAWLFEHELKQPHYWNVSLLAECEALSVEVLRAALSAVFAHHDVFALRFAPGATGWTCAREPEPEPPPFSVHDLSGESKLIRARVIEKIAVQANNSLNITSGPPAAAVLFRCGARDRLFITIHHLYFDGFSWLVFLEDLEKALGLAAAGKPIALPENPRRYTDWVRDLEHRARAGDWASEKEFWKNMHLRGGPRLPVPDFADREGDSARKVSELTRSRTIALAEQDAPLFELLLCALRRAFTKQYGNMPLFLETEGHGRGDDGNNARLVGWCNSFHPILLEADDDHPAAVAERLRVLPAGGRNYGLMRYLRFAEEFRALPAPQIKFMYHGRLPDQATSLFRRAPESAGPSYGPENRPAHLLYVYASIVDARLRVELVYGKRHFQSAPAAEFLSRIVNELQSVSTAGITKKT